MHCVCAQKLGLIKLIVMGGLDPIEVYFLIWQAFASFRNRGLKDCVFDIHS